MLAKNHLEGARTSLPKTREEGVVLRGGAEGLMGFGSVNSVEADFVLSNGRDARCPSPSRGREDGERVAVGNLHDPPGYLSALRGHSARDCEHEHKSGDGAGRHCRGSG